MDTQLDIRCDCGYCFSVPPEFLGQYVVCVACNSKLLVTLHVVDSPKQLPSGQSTVVAPENVPITWKPGEVYSGSYEVLDVLGKGGMGTVFRVRHRAWGIDVAVKCPSESLLMVSGFIDAVERECETWMKLPPHPNIVTCYYARRLGGVPRIFVEIVDGVPLNKWIEDDASYSGPKDAVLAKVLDIAIQMAWGIAHSHTHGVAHRDIKPANVLIRADGAIKVTDFGLATTVRQSGPEPRLRSAIPGDGSTGVFGLTQHYCSPEQALGEEASGKSDIWSWGVTVLTLFSRRVFWRSGSLAAKALDEYSKRSRDGITGIPIPRSFVSVLTSCFEVDPDDRPGDMGAVAERMITAYEEEFGTEFPRQPPKPLQSWADGQNNRAITLYDLGKTRKAKEIWAEIEKTTDSHLETEYNFGLIRWRTGKLTDEQLLLTLRALHTRYPKDPLPLYLAARVELERGALDQVQVRLGQAKRRGMEAFEPEIEALMDRQDSDGRGLLRKIKAHDGPVLGVAVSGSGNSLLSYGTDNCLHAWDLRDFDKSPGLVPFKEGIRFAGFLDDTDAMLICGPGGAYRGSASNRIIAGDWPPGGPPLLHADYARSRRLLACVFEDHTLRLYDVQRERRIFERRIDREVTSISVAGKGNTVAIGCADGRLGLLDWFKDSEIKWLAAHQAAVTAARINPSGQFVLSSSHDNSVKMWNVGLELCVRTFEGHRGPVTSCEWLEHSPYAVSTGLNGSVRMWDVTTSRCLRTFEDPGAAGYTCVAYNPATQTGISGSSAGDLWYWAMHPEKKYRIAPLALCRSRNYESSHAMDVEIESRIRIIQKLARHREFYRAAALVAKLQRNRTYAQHHGVRSLAEALYMRLPRRKFATAWTGIKCAGHQGKVTAVRITRHGSYVTTGGVDGTVRHWNAAKGELVHTYPMGIGAIECLAISGNQRNGYCGSAKGAVCMWDAKNKRVLKTLDPKAGPIRHLSTNQTGDVLAAAGTTLRVLDMREAKTILEDDTGDGEVNALLLNESATRLFTAQGENRAILVRDLPSGRILASLESHTQRIASLSMTADESRLLSVAYAPWSPDWELAIWDLGTLGGPLHFSRHTGERPFHAVLTNDLKFVVTVSANGEVVVSNTVDFANSGPIRVAEGAVTAVEMCRNGCFCFLGLDSGAMIKVNFEWLAGRPAETKFDARAEAIVDRFMGSLARRSTKPIGMEDLDAAQRKELQFILGCAGYGSLAIPNAGQSRLGNST